MQHHLSLKIQTKSDSETGEDYINGARNQPDKVVLTVIESDVGHLPGWADRMIQALDSIRKTRTLCNVVTSAKTYVNMLLTEITATVNEASQSGWQGTLTFLQTTTITQTTAKTNDNSSTTTHTGSTGTTQTVSGTALANLLTRAGINI